MSSTRPPNTPIMRRRPKYALGDLLVNQHDFIGHVDVIYADLYAAMDDFAVDENWWDIQTIKPSSKDQVFYGLAAPDGKGAAISGELDVRPVASAVPLLAQQIEAEGTSVGDRVDAVSRLASLLTGDSETAELVDEAMQPWLENQA